MRVAVIIVFYMAEVTECHLQIAQLDEVELILVDNTPKRKLAISSPIHYIPLKENKGIATAQNRGICKAIELDCEYVVFFDQDSKFSIDYIHRIINEYIRIQQYHSNIGLLGPTIINAANGCPYKSAQSSSSHHCKIVDALISSGSVVSVQTLKNVGFMEDELFIDCVDFEWCWRANSKGYVSVMTENVSLNHKVGQNDRSFLGYPIIISSPIRYYYQYRNYLLMCRRSYVPSRYKIKVGLRKLIELFIVPIMAKDGLCIFKHMLKGIQDGILK